MLTKFTDYQFEQFDQCFKKVMKEKLMSFYSYLTYHSTTNRMIKMSVDTLTSRWNNKYKKKARKDKLVCRATIYNWIKKLEAAKLLLIDDESSDTFVYTLIDQNIFLDKILDEELDKEICIKDIENTEFIDDEICDNSLLLANTIDIDSNTTTTVSPTVIPMQPEVIEFSNLNFKKYSEKCSYSHAMNMTLEVFKELKIYSNFIKAIVIEKVEKYYYNISKAGCKFYVAKIIKQAQAQAKRNFEIKCLYNPTSTPNSSTFCDYEQRVYDSTVEAKLLAWS